MSTRWRIFLAAVVLVVVPAGILAGFFRSRLLASATSDFAAASHGRIQGDLTELHRQAGLNAELMQGLTKAAADDNRLRLALVGGRDDLTPYLRDYATQVARTTRLDVLELLDSEGRILSSAHHRNEFGGNDHPLLQALAQAEGIPNSAALRSRRLDADWPDDIPHHESPRTAFAVERTPERRFLSVITRQDFTIGGHTYHWLGGWEPRMFADRLEMALITADTIISSPGWPHSPELLDRAGLADWGEDQHEAWEAATVPVILDGQLHEALLVIITSLQPLQRQREHTDRLMVAILVTVLLGAVLLAGYASWQLANPLVSLARQAEHIDLDHPDTDFHSTRGDEVGKLARVLGAMVSRLRASARNLARAEHRATLGEVARQVNHDLRNGITPVRNVVRHLGETAAREPDQLAQVFNHRRGTLDSSLAYLEDLAGRYAKLAPDTRREPCDLTALATEMAAVHDGVVVSSEPGAPRVLADPVSLRRILDNLLRNAREALPQDGGAIAVRIEPADDPDLGPQCVLTVSDDGVGMPAEVRDRVLEDFFTTKPGGSGLGLSNVRRLAGDAGGRLAIDSEPGRGTTITITFPGAENES